MDNSKIPKKSELDAIAAYYQSRKKSLDDLYVELPNDMDRIGVLLDMVKYLRQDLDRTRIGYQLLKEELIDIQDMAEEIKSKVIRAL
jgi:hypothetical protein